MEKRFYSWQDITVTELAAWKEESGATVSLLSRYCVRAHKLTRPSVLYPPESIPVKV
jgi:hypothetical protein